MSFPEFETHDILVYFNLVDKYFSVKEINTELQKFNLLSLHLPADVIARVRNTVLDPPRNTPYTILKTQLLAIFQPSSTANVTTFLSLRFSGSCSLLHQELLKVAGELNLPEEFLRDVFLSKLPASLKIPALSSPNLALNRLVARLDDIQNVLLAEEQSASVNVPRSCDSKSSRVRGIERTKPFSSRNASLPPQSFPVPDLCFYHHTFGAKAKNCKGPPCAFAKALAVQKN